MKRSVHRARAHCKWSGVPAPESQVAFSSRGCHQAPPASGPPRIGLIGATRQAIASTLSLARATSSFEPATAQSSPPWSWMKRARRYAASMSAQMSLRAARSRLVTGTPKQPVEIAAPGFATEFISLPAPDVRLPKVRLTKGEVVQGRVVDAATRRPVEGAIVARSGSVRRLTAGPRSRGCGTCYESWAKRQIPESTTDAAGSFEIRLNSTQREVTILAHGYRAATARLGTGENTMTIDRAPSSKARSSTRPASPSVPRASRSRPAQNGHKPTRRAGSKSRALRPAASSFEPSRRMARSLSVLTLHSAKPPEWCCGLALG